MTGHFNTTSTRSIGLCASCGFKKEIKSDRGSIFYMCQLSATDPRFPKYPTLPVLQCVGYAPAAPAKNRETS